MFIELCTDNVQDCLTANDYPIDRIELNSNLHAGGLTPSIGLIEGALAMTDIPITVMVRPRPGGFNYNFFEIQQMHRDIAYLLTLPIEGIVLGVLDDKGGINEAALADLARQVHRGRKTLTFHRAFDVITAYDEHKAMEILLHYGVQRVLTSGREKSLELGKDMVKALNEQYGKEITIVGGAGVNAGNIQELQDYTGLEQLHGSFSKPFIDPTCQSERLSYAYPLTQVDTDQLAQIATFK